MTVVPNLEGARAALMGERFDLLIVDYDLDDGKGDDLVRTCRARFAELPIIGSSAHDAGNAALLKVGAAAICSKMEFDTIRDVIESATKR